MVEFFLFCCSSQKIKIKINKFQRFKIITSPTKHKYRYFESFQEWHDKHLGLLIVFPYSVSMSMCIILYMYSLLVSCWIELYEINIGCSNILFSVFTVRTLTDVQNIQFRFALFPGSEIRCKHRSLCLR